MCSLAQNHDTQKTRYGVAAISAGYTLEAGVTASAQAGYRAYNFYLNAGMAVTLTRNATTPVVFPISLGYNIGSIQPFISYCYQTIGAEAEQRFRDTPDQFLNGWRLGGGVSYYFKSTPLAITVQQQGKQVSFSLTRYWTQ